MTSPTNRNFVLATLAACVLMLGVAGCEKKKKPPPPPPPPPPVHVEVPKPVDINAVLAEAKSDARVKFVDTQAPADRSLALATIKLANALAKGDAPAVKAMLDKPSQAVVDELISRGDWADATKGIEQVRVVSMTNTTDASPTSSLVGMAMQVPGDAYLLAWNAKKDGEAWTFGASFCQADFKTRASDFDGVSITTVSLPTSDETMGGLRPGGPGSPGTPGKTGSGSGRTGGGGETPPPPAPSAPQPDTIRKNTPAGPVNIPKGRPGGG
jgi:hypothetical protein